MMVLDFWFKALFSSNSITCIPWLTLLEIRTWLPTLDCLEAFRFDLHYRIAWRVQQNHGKGYGKAYSYPRAAISLACWCYCSYFFNATLTLPHGAVPTWHKLAKSVRVNMSKVMLCWARVPHPSWSVSIVCSTLARNLLPSSWSRESSVHL